MHDHLAKIPAGLEGFNIFVRLSLLLLQSSLSFNALQFPLLSHNPLDFDSQVLVAVLLVVEVLAALAGIIDDLRDLGLIDAILAGLSKGRP